MEKEKYETCIHVKSIGNLAVFVDPGCPQANLIRGKLVSSRKRCKECREWKGREENC